MQEYYWHLELYSGEIIKVRPDPERIKLVQDMIEKQQGAITTPTRSIIVKDVKDFRLSDEVYTDKKLLEASNQAFKEPIYNDDGSMQFRMVKKSVPRRKWENYYSKIPSYRLLEENDSFVTICFTLAVHDIDHTKVQELTDSDNFRMARVVKSVD